MKFHGLTPNRSKVKLKNPYGGGGICPPPRLDKVNHVGSQKLRVSD